MCQERNERRGRTHLYSFDIYSDHLHMKKHFTLNLDALLVITITILLAFGFIIFQRNQYSDLLEEHAQLQWLAQDLEINTKSLKTKLKQCNEPE
jgi:hypothetical protein